ncbi:response regulator [Paenibacillus sp. CF384]|uniref:response regulator n=1 Tax=Paenibacillus sp. CF384 TaxID=1884382 RepID=UPI000899013E|nr:response regulator [Paenibacillus sp. CF384]SDX99769.1 two-component system, response regulator YesN [Paenibacillus sp. CF384]
MIKLLVVEDESVTRKGLMKHIKWNELGVDVVEEARDGVEGLEVARRLHPDIVVSDIRMPGMNGIEFTTSLREQFPECQIIYMSGYSDKEYLKAAIRLHAVSYVEKPIIIEELQEVIQKAVQLCIENNKVHHINMALSDSLPFIRQNIVNGLIYNTLDWEELKRNLNLAGVAFDDRRDAYTISIIVPSYEDAETANEVKQSCCNRIMAFLHHASHGFIHLAVMKDSSSIIVLSAHKPENTNNLATIYQLLSEHVKHTESQCSYLSWIVGSTSSKLSEIRHSYETAAGYLQHLFYYDSGHFVRASTRTDSDFYTINEALITSYAKLLPDLQPDKIMLFTETLYQELRRKPGTSVDEVKSLFYQMMRMLVEQAGKSGLPLSISSHQNVEYYWAMMSKMDTLKQLKDYFLQRAAYILDSIEHIETNSRSVHDVIKFIRGNYSDKEISVNMLADHVHLTPTYLSSLFRKETGETISEYIAKVRIEKSADLLLEPQAKLYEVAVRSGYNDANYFAKAFKKIKGMTPSQFRRRHKS